MIRSVFLLSIGLLLTLAEAFAAGSGLNFKREVVPLLENYCHDCHADGSDKGGFQLDGHPTEAKQLADHEMWLKVWENLRSQMMPPQKKRQPTPAEREKIMRWIERDVFKVDPDNPDPGRVTIRRLNRTEYEYTIKDLLGVDFEADEEFPPDDTGYGFDTIGDVLSISPLLMENTSGRRKRSWRRPSPSPDPGFRCSRSVVTSFAIPDSQRTMRAGCDLKPPRSLSTDKPFRMPAAIASGWKCGWPDRWRRRRIQPFWLCAPTASSW